MANRFPYGPWTVDALEAEGFAVWKVERREGPLHTLDLFNLADYVAFRATQHVWIQATGPHGHAEHRAKMLANPFLCLPLARGIEVWLVSWRQLKIRRDVPARKAAKGKRARKAKVWKAKRWEPRFERLELEAAEVKAGLRRFTRKALRSIHRLERAPHVPLEARIAPFPGPHELDAG